MLWHCKAISSWPPHGDAETEGQGPLSKSQQKEHCKSLIKACKSGDLGEVTSLIESGTVPHGSTHI